MRLLVATLFLIAAVCGGVSALRSPKDKEQEKYYWFQQIWNYTLPRPAGTNSKTFPTGLGPIEGWAYDYLSGNFIVQQNGESGHITAFESFDNTPSKGSQVQWSVNVNDLGCKNVGPVGFPILGHNKLFVVEDYNDNTGEGRGILLFNCGHLSYAAIDAKNGTVLWTHSGQSYGYMQTMGSYYIGNNSMVLLVPRDSHPDQYDLKCIDIRTGARKWQRSVKSLYSESFPYPAAGQGEWLPPHFFANPTPRMTNRDGDSVFAVQLKPAENQPPSTLFTGLSVHTGKVVYRTIVENSLEPSTVTPALCSSRNLLLIPNLGLQASIMNISDGSIVQNIIPRNVSASAGKNLNTSQVLCEGSTFYLVANPVTGSSGTIFAFPLEPSTGSPTWHTDFSHLSNMGLTPRMYLVGKYALVQTGSLPGSNVILNLKDGSLIQGLGWACKDKLSCAIDFRMTSPVVGMYVPESGGEENVVLTSMQTVTPNTREIVNVPVTVATSNGKVSVAAPFNSSIAKDGQFNFYYVPTAGSQAPRIFMWNWRTVWFGLSGW